MCIRDRLKSGGYIVIDYAEAMTVIDVSTGKYVGGSGLQDTVVKVNLEAADEIANQLRLRDIGGIVVIDFIDMESLESREQVIQALRTALKRDHTRTNVIGLTDVYKRQGQRVAIYGGGRISVLCRAHAARRPGRSVCAVFEAQREADERRNV